MNELLDDIKSISNYVEENINTPIMTLTSFEYSSVEEMNLRKKIINRNIAINEIIGESEIEDGLRYCNIQTTVELSPKSYIDISDIKDYLLDTIENLTKGYPKVLISDYIITGTSSEDCRANQ